MTDTDPYIISFQSIAKHFGSVTAVDNVSLDIQRGEFFSLLGPSGCGKTTLLRLLAGLEAPSKGEVFIDGLPMSGIPAHLRPVNMVFQNYAIFPHLDVGGNIAFGLRKSGLSKEEVRSKVNEMLELIKLPGYAGRSATQLSGGERQRVALARALVKRPKVLLLDEPLGALDKQLREQMQLELRALQKTVGITFVFVTHDQEEALTMSDRIAVMSNGKVLQVSSPTTLYERPESRFVANFIGSMNLFNGRISQTDNNCTLVDAGPLGDISAGAQGSSFDAGDEILVAIRPERLRLHFSEPVGNENIVPGIMGSAAYLGDRSNSQIFVEGLEQPLAVATQTVDGAEQSEASADQRVWLSFSRNAVVLLAANRGQ